MKIVLECTSGDEFSMEKCRYAVVQFDAAGAATVKARIEAFRALAATDEDLSCIEFNDGVTFFPDSDTACETALEGFGDQRVVGDDFAPAEEESETEVPVMVLSAEQLTWTCYAQDGDGIVSTAPVSLTGLLAALSSAFGAEKTGATP
jgi:hypothetical protein